MERRLFLKSAMIGSATMMLGFPVMDVPASSGMKIKKNQILQCPWI